ncbi:MAG: tetratricopeptide repeat protein [Chthoniobacterales bacterium]|nr:tetratricopeptide repeat protein [Chthoniobacterales bacterium]
MLSALGVIDAGLGRFDDALRESRKAVELCPVSSDAVEGPGYVTNLANVYAALGDRDRAFEQLASVAKMPNGPSYGALKLDPTWASLRGDPRFAQLLAEVVKPILF